MPGVSSTPLLRWAPRAGLVLLLAALGAFEALFVAERARGVEALTAERTLREQRATDVLHEELMRQLDVAEARLEALETLPLLEEDGLLRVVDGVQWFPRVAGVRPLAPGDDQVLAALSVLAGGDSAALDGVEARSELARMVLKAGAPAERILRVWGWLPRTQAAELCVKLQRAAPRDGGLRAACQRGLQARVLAFAGTLGAQPAWRADQDGHTWLVVQRASAAGTSAPLPNPLPAAQGEGVLLADGGAAPRTARTSAPLSLPAPQGEGVLLADGGAAPRAAGTSAPLSLPASQGEGVLGATDLRGVELDVPATLERVTELLRRRAVLQPEDGVALETSPAALPTLRLVSPRLDAATRGLTDAFWWKTALLTLTALLGLSVVLLARLAERREQATLTLQREFIATVSHELRTPLAAIRVLAETLERKLGTSPAAKDYPRRLVAAVDGLGFLVENILSFNRISAGRLEPKRERFTLTALEPMLREDLALMVERPVTLDCSGLDALGSVEVDVALLRVLVLNLLRNTWKYAQSAERPTGPVFRVRGRVEGPDVILTFADDGPGIPADAHERVFEPFHRQPGVDATVRGSGLGLALARRIARLHGGELRISAASREGTTFELRLPR